ncbi:epimerase [bacterium]|nr:epimerase [bacterium]
MQIPDLINNVHELNDFMTTPPASVVDAIKKIPGDLLILGAGGKMGVSLAILAKRAASEAGVGKRVIAASRFSSKSTQSELLAAGVETIACNLMEESVVQALPVVENVIYMVGMKFGSTGHEAETWGVNTFLPGVIAQRFKDSRMAALSTGNVYPLTEIDSGGCKESDPVGPIGEYAQSALGRERILEYFSQRHQSRAVIIRLNYAIDLRYGVLLDVAQRVYNRQPIDLTMGYANVIWQGDANAMILRALDHAQTPPFVLNVTGQKTMSIREVANQIGGLLEVKPIFRGSEASTALLSDASLCHELLGPSSVTQAQMVKWVAHWVKTGGPTLAKPTHFETRDGRF